MEIQLTEGKKWEAVKGHLKRNKRKYLLGAALAGMEGGGYLLSKSGAKGLANKLTDFRNEYKDKSKEEINNGRQKFKKSILGDALKTDVGELIRPSNMFRSLLGTSTHKERIENKVDDEIHKRNPDMKLPDKLVR